MARRIQTSSRSPPINTAVPAANTIGGIIWMFDPCGAAQNMSRQEIDDHNFFDLSLAQLSENAAEFARLGTVVHCYRTSFASPNAVTPSCPDGASRR